jgi:hypothetical protein
MGGWGDVAHVPIHCLPPRSTSASDAIAEWIEPFEPVASNNWSPGFHLMSFHEASMACGGLSAGFVAGFCAIAGMDNSPIRVQVTVFAISLFMGPAPQKCLVGTSI